VYYVWVRRLLRAGGKWRGKNLWEQFGGERARDGGSAGFRDDSMYFIETWML
jgi:hypothetical protein